MYRLRLLPLRNVINSTVFTVQNGTSDVLPRVFAAGACYTPRFTCSGQPLSSFKPILSNTRLNTIYSQKHGCMAVSLSSHQYSFYSTDNKDQTGKAASSAEISSTAKEDENEQSPGILKRFKNAYKEYGKALVGVHCVTSAFWFGAFFYAAKSGVDVIPFLEKLGAGERILSPFRSSDVGNIAVAYLLYKVATPARYTLTIAGTQATVKQLRRLGYMKPVPEGDSLRELMKEGRAQVKEKVADRKEEWREKVADRTEEMRDKAEDLKGKLKDRRTDILDRADDIKDKVKTRVRNK